MPSPEELLARERLAGAAERRPLTEREAWDVRTAGLSGTLVTLRHGTDSISSMSLGPFHSARGELRDQRWHQNDNGETVLDRPDPSQNERIVTQTVMRVREPIDAWVLAQTYASGHASRTFFDARTLYMLRVEKTYAGRTTHTSYDDFRTDARGRTRPWHEFGGEERSPTAFDYRLVRDELDPPIGESELMIPHDRRALVEFPAGTQTVRLPARIENGRVYVRLTVGGRGLDFLLDSGSAAITIDDGVARSLGLTAYGRAVQTVAGSFATSRVVAPLINVGPLAMHDVVMRTIPISAHEGTATRIVGLLGFDFLAAVALKVDYATGTVDASRPGSVAAPSAAVPIDVRLGSQTPVARASVGDAIGNDFILDTGADFSLVLFQRFGRAHPGLAAPLHQNVLLGSGIGGSMAYRPVEPQRVTLGPLVLDQLPSVEAVLPNALGFDNEDGLIGSDVLRRFIVYFDYASGRVYLEHPRV